MLGSVKGRILEGRPLLVGLSLERQTEAELRRPDLRRDVLQELRRRALLVPMPQFGRLNTLKTSAIPSIETRPRSGIRCWSRRSVRFCAGAIRSNCAERSCRPDAGAALKCRARVAHVAAVGVRLADAGGEEVERRSPGSRGRPARCR